MGFEPTTASLEGWNSTTELRPPKFLQSLYIQIRAKPNKAYVQLAHRPFEIKPTSKHLRCLSGSPTLELAGTSKLGMVGRQGFEPWKT
jgi:hypothetical protein